MKRSLLFMLIYISPLAVAQECDCQKVVGRCSGAIDFVRGYGSKPSFGAEIIVHSSEKTCSKVEYYVDDTPYQTLLVNRNQEPESLFGTSPITQKSITYRSCQICSSATQNKSGPKDVSTQASIPEDGFVGSWKGTGRNSLGFSQQATVTVIATGGGQYRIDEVQVAIMTSSDTGNGTAIGKVLTYQTAGDAVDCTLTLTSATTASKRCSGHGTSNEITLKKQ
jgi:hypothetical protein